MVMLAQIMVAAASKQDRIHECMRRFQTLGLLAVVSIALGSLRGDNSEQVSVKLPFDAHQAKGGSRGNTTIKYHGGPVLLGTVPIFVIYYGAVPSGNFADPLVATGPGQVPATQIVPWFDAGTYTANDVYAWTVTAGVAMAPTYVVPGTGDLCPATLTTTAAPGLTLQFSGTFKTGDRFSFTTSAKRNSVFRMWGTSLAVSELCIYLAPYRQPRACFDITQSFAPAGAAPRARSSGSTSTGSTPAPAAGCAATSSWSAATARRSRVSSPRPIRPTARTTCSRR